MTNDSSQVTFEEPYTCADGTMVIPVTRRRRFGDPADKNRVTVGAYVAAEGNAVWVPAVDSNRIALIAATSGLAAAALATVAVCAGRPRQT